MDGDEVKVAVYNLYWTTFGGGEQMAGAIVDALSRDHEVEMIGHDPLDLDEARERLGVRLDGVTFRRVPADGYAATIASADYDLFVNHTYRSVTPSLARLGLYFVMFPHELGASTAQRVARRVGRPVAGAARLLGGVAERRGQAVIEGPTMVQVEPDARRVQVVLRSDLGEDVLATAVLPGAQPTRRRVDGRLEIEIPVPGEALGQVMVSPVLLAERRPEHARLVLEQLIVDGRPVSVSPRALAQRVVPVRAADFLATYQRVVANSDYTLGWTRRWWGRGEGVISPPVRMRAAGPKEQLIVSVGRFFGEGSGHSKRQLELVRAFRMMVEQGLVGWRLVLIGGCSGKDREYAMAVRREAAGLPVEVRLSAPGSVVDAHLAAASVYWHGAGYGSDLERHPDRAEHFGIAPIEAMSAGAVPVVFDAGGPASVVRSEVDGLRWRTLDDLAAQTWRLVRDDALRARLATSAAERAARFAVEHCEQNIRDTVAEMAAEVPR